MDRWDNMGVRWLAEPVELALDWLFPPLCAVCGQALPTGRDTLCAQCWAALNGCVADSYCPTCGGSVGAYEVMEERCHRCRTRRPAVDRTFRVGPYESPLKELILAFKFRRQDRLDTFLGRMMAAALLGRPESADIDELVPVPLHWRRLAARGYNQSALLARAVAARLRRAGRRVPVRYDLVRLKNTVPQAQLPAGSRKTNLRRAFALRYGVDLADRTVCLVDDVTTTGTTLRTTARLLKRAGARRVYAAVIAVAGDYD